MQAVCAIKQPRSGNRIKSTSVQQGISGIAAVFTNSRNCPLKFQWPLQDFCSSAIYRCTAMLYASSVLLRRVRGILWPVGVPVGLRVCWFNMGVVGKILFVATVV